jgi:hypothetical protein
MIWITCVALWRFVVTMICLGATFTVLYFVMDWLYLTWGGMGIMALVWGACAMGIFTAIWIATRNELMDKGGSKDDG